MEPGEEQPRQQDGAGEWQGSIMPRLAGHMNGFRLQSQRDHRSFSHRASENRDHVSPGAAWLSLELDEQRNECFESFRWRPALCMQGRRAAGVCDNCTVTHGLW